MILPRRCPTGVCSCKNDCCFMFYTVGQFLHSGVYVAETLPLLLVKKRGLRFWCHIRCSGSHLNYLGFRITDLTLREVDPRSRVTSPRSHIPGYIFLVCWKVYKLFDSRINNDLLICLKLLKLNFI